MRAQPSDRVMGLLPDIEVLYVGMQDTGPDGGLWALRLRGLRAVRPSDNELALFWTIRRGPHLYRRAELRHIAAAVEPFSDSDAGKRVYDAVRAKTLWPVLGRPGAVLIDGEIVGTWRPRQTGNRLRVGIEPWTTLSAPVHATIAQQAELLANHRQVRLAAVDDSY